MAPHLGATRAEYREIPAAELYEADELFLVGGDTHFFCIRELDGKPIGCFQQQPDLVDAPASSMFARIRAALRKESVESPAGGGMNTIDLNIRQV